MAKKNNAARALLTSLVSCAMCISMFVGTTFAWFTDEVTSTGNIITTGTLDVTMEWANGTEAPAEATWKDASEGAIFNNTLWEPGYTEARHLKITNKGTLALNWSLSIETSEVSKLSDVIDVYQYGANRQVTDRDNLVGFTYMGTLTEWLGMAGVAKGSLDAGKSTALTIVLKMRGEEVGNEYQGLGITNFSVKLLATQKSQESDSLDNTYDKYAGKTVVTPASVQSAIHAAKEGDVIYLASGAYETLVLENEDGSPKKGITIEHDKPGNNYVSDPFSIDQINLNGSEDIVIRGIYFDVTKAQTATKDYVASIISAKAGAAVGAKNVVIENCRFAGTSNGASNYVAICFEEQGRPTRRATDITVSGCYFDKGVFNFIRMNYMAQGTITIQGNFFYGGANHSALNFTGNSANLMIRNNSFGRASMSGMVLNAGWNVEKAMLGTSRQGSNHITVEVTGNTFINNALVEGEGHVIELKSTYKPENTTLVFENNTFSGKLAGMTENTVPCIWHN